MSLLKKLAALFTPEGARDAYTYWVYVQCNRCGEKIRTRVDLRNDLSIRYGETERDTIYHCHKTIIGNGRCFQAIEVDLLFDARRQLTEWEIQRGKIITEKEFFGHDIEL